MDDLKKAVKYLSGRLSSGRREPDFFEQVRLLRLLLKEQNGDRDPQTWKIQRFGQVPHLNFPETALAGIEENSAGQILLQVYFFGLLGGNGPMPLNTSAYALQRLTNHYDRTMVRFFDIFNHHFLKLYYQAWARQNTIVGTDDEKTDSVKKILRGLSGAPAILDEGDWKNQTNAMVASVFAYSSFRRGREELQVALSRFFGIPVRLETRIMSLCSIPKECRFHQGKADTSVQGTNMQLGRKMPCLSRKVRFTIGPVTFAQYKKMVPGTPAFQHFRTQVGIYLNRPMQYEIVFKQISGTIPPISLNSETRQGRSFWMGKTPVDPDIRIYGSTHQMQCPDSRTSEY